MQINYLQFYYKKVFIFYQKVFLTVSKKLYRKVANLGQITELIYAYGNAKQIE